MSANDVLSGRARGVSGPGSSSVRRSSLSREELQRVANARHGATASAPSCNREKLAELGYSGLRELAFNMDVRTGPGKAVFWSSEQNMKAAHEFVKSRKGGLSTIEYTRGGAPLNDLSLFSCKSGTVGAEIWNIASQRFADQARGVVYVFADDATPIGEYGVRTWFKIELPRLLKNGPEVVTDIRRVSRSFVESPYFASAKDRAAARAIVMRARTLEEGGTALARIVASLPKNKPIRMPMIQTNIKRSNRNDRFYR